MLKHLIIKWFGSKRDRWNEQYTTGRWAGLAQEHTRFEVLRDLLRASGQPSPSVLEVGCGEALFFSYLSLSDYGYFEGIDLSDVAIERVQHLANEQVRFGVADMAKFVSERRFDVIIFTESLYYSAQPAALLAQYESLLTERGVFLISAIQNKYTAALWPALAHYHIVEARRVSEGLLCWDIQMLSPKP
jgi:2-polyprenyl-3-methyl-5-hydroxy-6-metoxy-1,4-benzoquinol methylase